MAGGNGTFADRPYPPELQFYRQHGSLGLLHEEQTGLLSPPRLP